MLIASLKRLLKGYAYVVSAEESRYQFYAHNILKTFKEGFIKYIIYFVNKGVYIMKSVAQ